MKTAYALLLIRTDTDPPSIAGYGIYGESWPTTRMASLWVEIRRAEAATFEEACDLLKSELQENASLQWFWRMLS